MLDVCANLIADARARINGIDADKLISLCERCDLHGRDVLRVAASSNMGASLIAIIAMCSTNMQVGYSPLAACNIALKSNDRSKCKPFVLFIWHVMHAMAKCDPCDNSVSCLHEQPSITC
jgi:hypothetical protein